MAKRRAAQPSKEDDRAKKLRAMEELLRKAKTAGLAGRWIVPRLQDVADFFGVQRDTVRKDWRNQGMPGAEGRYDVAEIARWKLARLVDALKNAAPTALDDKKLYEEWRAKWLKNEATAGNLWPRADVEQEFAMALQMIRTRLQAIPDELESEIPREVRVEVKRRWQDKINLALKELSECRPQ